MSKLHSGLGDILGQELRSGLRTGFLTGMIRDEILDHSVPWPLVPSLIDLRPTSHPL